MILSPSSLVNQECSMAEATEVNPASSCTGTGVALCVFSGRGEFRVPLSSIAEPKWPQSKEARLAQMASSCASGKGRHGSGGDVETSTAAWIKLGSKSWFTS